MALAAVWMLAFFTACGGLDENDLLSVRNRANGKVVTLGESRGQVEGKLGDVVWSWHEFEEDGVLRVQYQNVEGLWIDYLDDTVVAIRVDEGGKWEVATGARYGMEKSKAEALYENYPNREVGLSGGILLSFDRELNPIAFDPDSPYSIVISFEDDVVEQITVQYNFELDD